MSDVKLPRDLLIFSPLDHHQSVVAPVSREDAPGRHRLGPLVLVVRELEVETAAVKVEVVAEQSQ